MGGLGNNNGGDDDEEEAERRRHGDAVMQVTILDDHSVLSLSLNGKITVSGQSISCIVFGIDIIMLFVDMGHSSERYRLTAARGSCAFVVATSP